jgi:hypothetical protein
VLKEVPVWLVVKLWASIGCAGALPIAQHTRVTKIPTQACDLIFLRVSLANHGVV